MSTTLSLDEDIVMYEAAAKLFANFAGLLAFCHYANPT